MARTLIKALATARRGEVIEIRTTIGHPMETGFRPGDDGSILQRELIKLFSCSYNGELVFSAELFSAIAADPTWLLHTVATDSGTLPPPGKATTVSS